MDNKEVFQLAQDKGYIDLFFFNKTPESPFYKDYILLELTLIQKWLRDEHRIFVSMDIQRANCYCFRIMILTTLLPNLYFGDTYEQALLECISEALKLIK